MDQSLPEVPEHLYYFAKVNYANHDTAHNFSHAFKVFRNAVDIIRNENIRLTEEEKIMLPYVMLCHDLRDHKLASKGFCISEEELFNYYKKYLGVELANDIIHIHANCSWSNRKFATPALHETLRKILQDADWLEAIGETGIQRCIEYTTVVGGVVPTDVCKHIREKLLLIPKELNYEYSRRVAQDLIVPVEVYLAVNEN